MILHSPTANTWTLRLLLTQLYDPAMEVCELATQFLEEACESVDILQLVVAMQPTLDHLGDVGHGLLLKCVNGDLQSCSLLELCLQVYVDPRWLPVSIRLRLHRPGDGHLVPREGVSSI
jgi:Rapamycin-insensitive companion of mTOR RasGEF_N domain